MSCCQKPADAAPASSCCTPAASSCGTEGGKCCPIQKLQCAGKCAGALVLRLAVAGFMLPFGYGKITDWSGTVAKFSQYMQIPAPLTWMAILTEFFGPILLILGLFTRAASFALFILIVVAAVKGGHIDKGFMGTVTPEGVHLNDGFALHLLYGGAALALTLIGPGKMALDSVICCLISKKKACCTK